MKIENILLAAPLATAYFPKPPPNENGSIASEIQNNLNAETSSNRIFPKAPPDSASESFSNTGSSPASGSSFQNVPNSESLNLPSQTASENKIFPIPPPNGRTSVDVVASPDETGEQSSSKVFPKPLPHLLNGQTSVDGVTSPDESGEESNSKIFPKPLPHLLNRNKFNGIEKTINSIVQETSSIHGITTTTTTGASVTITTTTTTTSPPATTAMMTTEEVTEVESRPVVFEENSEDIIEENKHEDDENIEEVAEDATEDAEEITEDEKSQEGAIITEATQLESSDQMSTPPGNETQTVSLVDTSNTRDQKPIPLNPALKMDGEGSANSAEDDIFSGNGPIYVEVVTEATENASENANEIVSEDVVLESNASKEESGSGDDVVTSELSALEASTFEGSSDFSGSGGSTLDIEVDFKGPRPGYSITTQGTTVTTTSTATTTSTTTTTTTMTTTTTVVPTTTTSTIKATSTTHLPLKGPGRDMPKEPSDITKEEVKAFDYMKKIVIPSLIILAIAILMVIITEIYIKMKQWSNNKRIKQEFEQLNNAELQRAQEEFRASSRMATENDRLLNS